MTNIHVYDLDLKKVYYDFKAGVENLAHLTSGKTSAYHVKLIEDVIENYCTFKKLNFDKDFQIIITPAEEGAYKSFLPVSLIFLDHFKIRRYLDYHQRLFTSFNKDEHFPGFLEFIAVNTIKKC